MCGICGIFAPGRKQAELAERVAGMCASLVHRGPDDEGIFAEDGIALGARRLSIVDLAHGHQPFHTPDGAGVGVMNGEIYNYRDLGAAEADRGYEFTSQCDTEVMLARLHREGVEALPGFRGIFALAYWDRAAGCLLIARDHLGVKPLYFHTREERGERMLVFASELKALLASGLVDPELDLTAARSFLTVGYIPGHRAPITGVRQLPPASSLRVDASTCREARYWHHPDPDEVGDAVSAADLRDRVEAAVAGQLTGDVPIGLLLSAGLDSSAVLQHMRQAYRGPLHTFTARFDDPRFDEGDVAAGSAAESGTEHHEVRCGPADLAEHFPSVVRASGGLIANTAAFPIYMVCRLAGQHLKVVLSGLGGDEMFFGYPTYQADQLAAITRRFPRGFLRAVGGVVDCLPVSHGRVSLDYKLRKFLEGAAMGPEKAHYWWRTIFTDNDRRQLLEGATDGEDAAWAAFEAAFGLSGAADFLHRATVCDFDTWLACMALPMNDGCSMAHSVEMRVPLLDVQLVEAVFRVPRRQRFVWRKKGLFRAMYRGHLRGEVLRQPKQGFHIPLAGWLCDQLKPFMVERLAPHALAEAGLDFVRSAYVETLVQQHLSHEADNSYRLWNLLVLGEWSRQFVKGGV